MRVTNRIPFSVTQVGINMTESEQKLSILQETLDNSEYTVVLCGSGMLEELNLLALKTPERAYEIEDKYGVSPEYIFSDGFYSTRTDRFFEFYRNEMLIDIGESKTAMALARLQKEGKIQSIITSNIYDLCQRAGCENVIALHGSIYNNKCSHCGKSFPMEYIKSTNKVPTCDECGAVIRPQISLFGDMIDAHLIALTATEIEKADVLLILGSSIESEVFSSYIKYFNGSKLVVIHKDSHLKDKYADLLFYDQPANVIPKLL